MKKASSRSQRGSKGIKGKHVLQICVLLGVCIWLIYQVKYSHDKKKEFYEKDGKKSTVLLSESGDGLVKLGRKDLLPGYHNQKENEKHVEEEEDEEEISHVEEEKEGKSKVEESGNNHEEEEKEEEEEVVEEDEEDKNKQGEEVVEEDEEESKHEEDEIDEQDQSKTGGDSDKDDELLEEGKEKQTNRHADEVDMTVDEAREEHYKADDASSAVSHESRVLSTEKLKESSGNSTETAQENDSNAATSEVKIQKEPLLKLGEAESVDFVNKTATEVKDGDNELKSAVIDSRGETVNGNSSESAILEASGFLQNETEIMRDRSREDGAPPVRSSDLQTVIEIEQTRNESDSSNITVSANITNNDSIQDESKNSTLASSLIENISGSNTTSEVKENSGYEGEEESGEKESSNLDSTDQTEEVDDDTSENSISQEERDDLIDPQTLPDIRIEGNEDDEEAIGAE